MNCGIWGERELLAISRVAEHKQSGDIIPLKLLLQ